MKKRLFAAIATLGLAACAPMPIDEPAAAPHPATPVVIAPASAPVATPAKPEGVPVAEVPVEKPARPVPQVRPEPDPTTATKPGGYYLNDGPPEAAVDISKIPEPVPTEEPEHPRANDPYMVDGELITPDHGPKAYRAQGVASWYGKRFHGRKTASGERYDMYAFSAAHRTLPLPSFARVTNLKNGKSVIVRVNDRGPFHSKRILDVSYAAALKLGFIGSGQAEVLIERVLPGEAKASPTESTAVAAAEGPAFDPAQFYWQVAAFKTPTLAAAHRQRLLEQLTDGASRLLVSVAGSRHRVLYGPYTSEVEARAALDNIPTLAALKPFLVRPASVALNQP